MRGAAAAVANQEVVEIVRKICFALAGVVLAIGVRSLAGEPSRAFKVVAHPNLAGQKIRREVLAQIYLGNAERWGDGKRIVAVDQSSTSAVREAFSGTILGMPVDGVKWHWMRIVRTGKRPPMIKGSDEDVLAFV